MNPPTTTAPAQPAAASQAAEPGLIDQAADTLWAITHRLATVWTNTDPATPATGKSQAAHLGHIHAALLDLNHTVHDALAGRVPAEFIDDALRPVLAGVRTALHAPDRPDRSVDLNEFEPDLCDGYPDNLDRAAWAAEAVRTFGLRTRQISPRNGASVDGVEEMTADLICDLMHLLDAIGANAEYTVERGLGYHLDEVEEAENDSPRHVADAA